MTVYYDPQKPALLSLFQWKDTVFGLVFGKAEFWAYMAIHVMTITISTELVDPDDISGFRWEAAGAMQFFMSFFLTFFNEKCYARFNQIYPQCCALSDSVLLFVHELTISLPFEDCRGHRTMTVKYIIALIYLFYMGTTGGTLSKGEWREAVLKGLLTQPEADMLMNYPGGRCTMVLASWTMLIVKDALVTDQCWQSRSPQTVHIYNRLNKHLITLLRACHMIGNIIALPIPFAYYHLMNVILVLNFLLMAIVPALFLQTYWSVFPFAMALLIYMGLREVSAALADPFGQDEVDFPVARFLDHTFDQSITLLESFMLPEAYDRTRKAIDYVEDFSDAQLRRQTKQSILYDKAFKPALHNPFAWNRVAPLQMLDESAKVIEHLHRSLLAPPDMSKEAPEIVKKKEEAKRRKTLEEEELLPAKMELQEKRKQRDELEMRLADLRVELEKLRQIALETGHAHAATQASSHLDRMEEAEHHYKQMTEDDAKRPKPEDKVEKERKKKQREEEGIRPRGAALEKHIDGE